MLGFNVKDLQSVFPSINNLSSQNILNLVPDRIDRWNNFASGPSNWFKDHWLYPPYKTDTLDFDFDQALKKDWINPADLSKVFSLQEMMILNIVFGSYDLNQFFEKLEKENPEAFVWYKIFMNFWHYSHMKNKSDEYDLFCETLESIKKLKPLLPDFELRLTWADSWQPNNLCFHDRDLWLDSEMGLLIYYKNKHVLTFGFSIGNRCLYYSQAQLRQKKGNRFLFNLSWSVLEWGIKILEAAFVGWPIYLVTGESAAAAIKKCYAKCPEKFKPETEDRIKNLYNSNLNFYRRNKDKEPRHCWSREYILLEALDEESNKRKRNDVPQYQEHQAMV